MEEICEGRTILHMLAYIIRLDDATPTMNKSKWYQVECILDKYNVKPIVGIIPESRDPLFNWNEDIHFWEETVNRWQSKEWVIAQHGCYHTYNNYDNGIGSEFVGLNYDEQMSLVARGYTTLKRHGVTPTCFYAPAHTFDSTTVDVIRDSGFFDFISDGYAIYPYKENGMLFMPNIFNTAHKVLPFGVYTFVLHPSFATEEDFDYLEEFIKKHRNHFISVQTILENLNKSRKRNLFEKVIEPTITFAKGLKNKMGNMNRSNGR